VSATPFCTGDKVEHDRVARLAASIGGVPLDSMATHITRDVGEERHEHLAKLALLTRIHTEGVSLERRNQVAERHEPEIRIAVLHLRVMIAIMSPPNRQSHPEPIVERARERDREREREHMSRNAERRSIKWHAACERASDYTLMGQRVTNRKQASKASEQAYLLDALIEIEGSHGGQGSSNRSAGASEMAERGREQQTKERRSESERVGLAPSVEQSCCSSLLALSCFLNWTSPQNRLDWIDD